MAGLDLVTTYGIPGAQQGHTGESVSSRNHANGGYMAPEAYPAVGDIDAGVGAFAAELEYGRSKSTAIALCQRARQARQLQPAAGAQHPSSRQLPGHRNVDRRIDAPCGGASN